MSGKHVESQKRKKKKDQSTRFYINQYDTTLLFICKLGHEVEARLYFACSR